LLGYEGTFSGGNHEYMVLGQRRLTIPNRHSGEIGVQLLARVLRQAGISRESW
jgi:predicted RNA binding protein YcfA (HicA-like mRNA interferase family)